MRLHRYSIVNEIKTKRDPFEDLYRQIKFLISTDFTIDILTQSHNIPATSAITQAKAIAPHAKAASHYIDQARNSPKEITFLPIYYSILNLMKICVLAGPHHALLPRHKWHGATYDPHGKDSHNLLNEVLTLKDGGVIPLYYETITGRTYSNNTKVYLKDIIPFIVDIGWEVSMATGTSRSPTLSVIEFEIDQDDNYSILRARARDLNHEPVHGKQLHAIHSMRKHVSDAHLFLSPRYTNENSDTIIHKHIRRYMLYDYEPGSTLTPISGKQIHLFSELNIALLFFHLGAIARYKPDFLYSVLESRYGPIATTASDHLFYQFLLHFWSFMIQRTLFITRI